MVLFHLPSTLSSRVPEKEFIKAFKTHPRLKTKVNNFNRQMASNNNSEEDFVAVRPEWTTVDRIIACRLNPLKTVVLFPRISSLSVMCFKPEVLNFELEFNFAYLRI